MAEIQPFTGFPKAGIKFLADLAENNNRDWFNAHKQTFVDELQTPALGFVVQLGERLKKLSPGVVYDTRTNGAGSLMRIYRDTRFSPDKTPYKTHISMLFWEGPSKKESPSGFYLRVEPSGVGMFVGQHKFGKEQLKTYRDAVANPAQGKELDKALAKVKATGVHEIGGEHYKRVPRGFDPEDKRADLLRYNGLYTFSPRIGRGHLGSPKLVDLCYEEFAKMAPLHKWLVKIGL